jgi:flagellar protein FliT
MDPVIEQYQHLSGITGKMREAATHGEWDKLIELEQQCNQHVSLMKKQNFAAPDENTRLQKVALINKILADDAMIRDQTQPWMAQLQQNMQSNRNEQRVQHAYGSDY